MSLNEIMSATAYVTGTPFSQIESLKRENLEDAYKYLLFDKVLKDKFQWKVDSSFKGFKQEGEGLKNGKWKTIKGIPINPDIVAYKNKNKDKDRILIEIKRFYIKSALKYKFPQYFKSHDYNFLYGKVQSIDYKLVDSPICKDWKDTNNIFYSWLGGPILTTIEQNNKCEYHPTFWQEGQIWWDIHRMLYIKNHAQEEKYRNAQLYFIGFIEKDTSIPAKNFFAGLSERLNAIVAFYKNSSSPYIYTEYKAQNPKKLLGNCGNSLQRFKKESNFSYKIILIKGQDSSENIWASFIIRIF